MRIDFHSHILPGVDDGAPDVRASLKLLEMLKSDGVEVVVATPHLYLHQESAESFLLRRAKSARVLAEAVAGGDYPRVLLGAEVYYSPSLNRLEGLERLCIAGTRYMLVEMPYQSFSTGLLGAFADFVDYSGVKTVLAHVERYYPLAGEAGVNAVLGHELLAQFNCDSVLRAGERRRVVELIKSGLVQIMGTDAHHPVKRPPNFGKAEQILQKKIGKEGVERLMTAAERILADSPLSAIKD